MPLFLCKDCPINFIARRNKADDGKVIGYDSSKGRRCGLFLENFLDTAFICVTRESSNGTNVGINIINTCHERVKSHVLSISLVTFEFSVEIFGNKEEGGGPWSLSCSAANVESISGCPTDKYWHWLLPTKRNWFSSNLLSFVIFDN